MSLTGQRTETLLTLRVCVCDSQITASSIGWIHLNMATYVTLMWEYIAESDPTFNDAMSLLFFYVYYIYIYLLYLLWKAMQSVFRGFMDGQWDIGIRNPYWSSSCFAERSEAVATHTHTHTHTLKYSPQTAIRHN